MSICLVMHELPGQASKAVMAEAFRILRPGGTFAIMVGNLLTLSSHCSQISPLQCQVCTALSLIMICMPVGGRFACIHGLYCSACIWAHDESGNSCRR